MADTDRVDDAAKRALEAEAERTLARRLATGLPIATVLGAIGLGIATNFATGVLVVVGGALVAVIAWTWASLRTLAGDAPLPLHLEEAAVAVLPLDEKRTRKKMLLRALKDLESENAIGKLDAEDFETIALRYRGEIKQIMREMDAAIAPYRKQAEAAAQAYLEEHGEPSGVSPSAAKQETEDAPESDGAAPAASSKDPASARASAAHVTAPSRPCPSCEVANDTDAKFCKACATSLGEPA